MPLTPNQLAARENALLDALEHTPGDVFLSKLYRDGVPTPASYPAQPVRVLFVFREPNAGGVPSAHDMRDEVRDERFRPLVEGLREDRRVTCWWNNKAGLFAHAVAAALDGRSQSKSFEAFTAVIDRRGWNHEVVNRFAYIQIKKLGGRGRCNVGEICEYAETYAKTLKAQVDLYRPHLVIGCGIPPASPAELLNSRVLRGGQLEKTSATGASWWRFPATARPLALVQLYHPARRGSRSALYSDVWRSVHEVIGKLGIGRRS